jgi:hypothetical protein
MVVLERASWTARVAVIMKCEVPTQSQAGKHAEDGGIFEQVGSYWSQRRRARMWGRRLASGDSV